MITGGDSGIGRAGAIAYAREGADILISYLNEQKDEDARETARHVEAAGRRCVLVPGDIPDEEWSYTFRTNIEAMFHLAKAAVPHMRPGSSIINTTSIQSDQPNPMLLAYASAKGAVSNFTAGLAQMLGRRGSGSTPLPLGPIWTPLIPSTMPD